MMIFITYNHFNSIKSMNSMNLNNTIDFKEDELKIDKIQKLPDALIIGVSKCGWFVFIIFNNKNNYSKL